MAVDAEAYALLGQVAGAGIAIGGPVVGVVIWLQKKFDKKADKQQVDKEVKEVKEEQSTQRSHIGKLFDKLEEHSRRDEELAREVLSTMASNHAEVLRELGRKVDR